MEIGEQGFLSGVTVNSSAPVFQLIMTPSFVTPMIASRETSTIYEDKLIPLERLRGVGTHRSEFPGYSDGHALSHYQKKTPRAIVIRGSREIGNRLSVHWEAR
jgi:hypothetical protein